jgi:hypothetical protein
VIRPILTLLLALPCGAVSAQEGDVSADTAPLEELVADAIARGEVDELAARVAGLGPTAVPGLLTLLETRRVEGGDCVLRLREPYETALLDALEELGREAVLGALAAHVDDPATELPRRGALRALARVAATSDLDVVLFVATEDGRLARGAEIGPALAEVVVHLVELSPAMPGKLMRVALDAEPITACAIVQGFGRVPGADSLGWLVDLLVYREDIALSILSQIKRVAGSAPPPHAPELLERMRAYFYGQDAQLAREATHALGALQDFEVVPDLIQNLASDSYRARADAHAALRSITGLSLPASERIWRNWLDSEETWYAERAPACFDRLEYGDTREVLAALRELIEHRYRRHESAQRVAVLLSRPERRIRRDACHTLRGLASRSVELDLAYCLDDPEAEVARAARAALVALVGHERVRELEEAYGGSTPAAVPPSAF